MTQRKPAKRTEAAVLPPKEPTALLAGLRDLILQAREGVARAVDSGLTALYWHVGRRIRQDILKEKRAEYGAQIVAALGRQLETEFGCGFGEKNLRRMIRFAEVFPESEIVASLMRQLTWTHFIELMPLDKPLERDFSGLKDTYAEKDLEAAILREMEAFILDLGVGFCFVARQQRIEIDDRDYYLDLLFYHRKLRRLIAIPLEPAQIEFHLAFIGRLARPASRTRPRPWA